MKEHKDRVVEKLQFVENWAETHRKAVRELAADKKQSISDFFAAKALLMDPPLEMETLKRMDCFHAAVASASEPSERAWKCLEPKLQAQRGKAEALLVELEERKQSRNYGAPAGSRWDYNRADQDVVLGLADEVLETLVRGPESLRVADGDFVRIALTRVFNSYQEYYGGEGYALSLDDAKLVYRDKIQPIIDSLKGGNRRKTAMELRCPGCKKGTKGRWLFECLMVHIKMIHSHRVGDFDDFRADRSGFLCRWDFPWSFIKWPTNLPILAAGQDATGQWDLHAHDDEHFSPPFSEIPGLGAGGGACLGAFYNRVVKDCYGPSCAKFVDNVIFAASKFDELGSTLSDQYKTQIVLEFALQKLQLVNGTEPDTKILKDLRLELLRKGLKGVFEGFRCKQCCDDAAKDGRKGYFARSIKSLGQLSDHFEAEHSGDWTRDMLDLPTAQHLLTQLQLPSNRQSYRLFKFLFPAKQDFAKFPLEELEHSEESDDVSGFEAYDGSEGSEDFQEE